MKKARVELISLNTVDEKETSSYIFVLTDEVTDEDLLELISILENKTEQVCHDWAWCIPPSQSRELINNKLITLEQL